jgi:SAM-dependent methyltransferase
MKRAHFGADYFRKYYLSPSTRVVSPREMHERAALMVAILRHARIPVRRILDAGCGIGLLQKPFAALLPRARYTGLEHSEYLCDRYGWTRGSVATYVAAKPYDLVVCYDVLQYLGDREAETALANFATLSRAALYVSALTRADWRENCDRGKTDGSVHLRTGNWYRRRLEQQFRHLGFGVWLRHDVTVILWEMEQELQ